MKTMSARVLIAAMLGLAACGSVESNGGNDVPNGPAVPIATSAPDCTRSGAGIDATVTPLKDGSVAAQGYLNTPQTGVNPNVPICYDQQAQAFTAPALSLTQMAFVIKDGVVQEPPSGSVQIVAQWFEWDEPTAGTCQAVINAVVNVTDGSTPTCTVALQFGAAVADPVGTYAVSGS